MVTPVTSQVQRLEEENLRLRIELARRDAAIAEFTAMLARLRETEAALERRERDMRAVLDNLPSMIGYWDKSLHNRFANHAYSTWFGIDYRTIPGKHIREVIGEERYALNLPYIEGALRGEEQFFERAIPAPDGSLVRHSLAHYIPDILDGEVQGFFVLVSDVTQLKAIEAELRRTNEDLEQFAYVASHDLREPLRMISAYMGLVERRYANRLEADGREFIAFARDGAARLDGMIVDLLELSRVGRRGDPFAAVSLDDAVATALAALGAAVQEAGARVTIEPGLGTVTGSHSELVRLFQNLLGNAVKYRDKWRPAEISVRVVERGKTVTIAVADNGIGIPTEASERVFTVFQRLHTHAEYEGSGVGLAICRKIVQHHGGSIRLESEPDKGSTFLITLPASPAI